MTKVSSFVVYSMQRTFNFYLYRRMLDIKLLNLLENLIFRSGKKCTQASLIVTNFYHILALFALSCNKDKKILCVIILMHEYCEMKGILIGDGHAYNLLSDMCSTHVNNPNKRMGRRRKKMIPNFFT